MRRLLLRSLTIGLLLTAVISGVLVAPVTGARPTATAEAANLGLFDPGNIISDAVFLDSASMDAPTVQAFLTYKGSNCVAGAMPCLKDYTQTTYPQSGDAYCSPYQGAPNETAATIITKVGLACHINPRVLLVLLQKEQGLVTGTKPTVNAYTKATGFSCPDTSSCNPAFAGFVSQIYFAARQFQRYRAGVVGSYRAGVVNTIGYLPAVADAPYNNLNNWRCGTKSVFIVNKATAALYDYTPYVPNAAALAAGYGLGDSCSAYGNRNFYNYFTDWFGSTGFRVSGPINSYYIAQGGGTGRLGGPLDEMYCSLSNGGCGQDFQGGAVYWSPASGAHTIGGAIQAEWNSRGAETSPMAYPTADVFCGLTGSGCGQWFQGGAIYWSPGSGAHMIGGDILAEWVAQGYEIGPLGFPVADVRCGLSGGGCSQAFQGGDVYWSPSTGARLLGGDIRASYVASGAQDGALGYPTADVDCTLAGGGCHQTFAHGTISWTAGTGAHAVTDRLAAPWSALGAEAGPLGYPTADMACGLTRGGCAEAFQGGFVFWTPSGGAHATRGVIGQSWRAGGGQDGQLGYPVGDLTCTAATACYQAFERGQLAWTSSDGVRSLGGAMSLVWAAQGAGGGDLGYPVTDIDCTLVGGGCRQDFANGSIYWSSASGGWAVSGPVETAWRTQGAEGGSLGYPTGALVCTSADACSQPFQNGQLAWTSTSGAHWLGGAMSLMWTLAGRGGSAIGYPVADIDCTQPAGGCLQRFERGTIVWSPAAGAYVLAGGMYLFWTSGGGAAGPLGYPMGAIDCTLVGGGCRQAFQGGWLYWSSVSGVHDVAGGIGMVYRAQGAERGPLGYPTAEGVCSNGGCYQQFQFGLLSWTQTRGVIMVNGGIGGEWGDQGAGDGPLGYPRAAITCTLVGGGCRQDFDHGSIYWQAAVGTHTVSGSLGSAWASRGGERGPLGYPVADAVTTPSGQSQAFQGGTLTWDSTSGTVTGP